MKKTVALLLAILFVISFATSCDTSANTPGVGSFVTERETSGYHETVAPTDERTEAVATESGDENSSDAEPAETEAADASEAESEPTEGYPTASETEGNATEEGKPGNSETESSTAGTDKPAETQTEVKTEGKTEKETEKETESEKETETETYIELTVIAIEMTGTYGDSYIIKYGDFEILVDAGTTDDERYVQNALDEFVADDELDLLMLSHLHADHIGAMTSTSFFDSIGISVKTIVDPGTTPSSNTARNYESMRNSLVSKGAEYYNYYDILNDSSISTKWYIDEKAGVYIEFFNTGSVSKPGTKPSDINSSSIAFALNYNNNKWFFAGDLPAASESTLVSNIKKIDTDYFKESDYVVFKSCHHGSNGSNTDELLAFVKPDMAFIMTGIVSKNQQNQTITSQHPYLNALNRIKKYTTKVYWSAINGLTIFKSTGNEVTFDARGRTADYYYNGKIVSREEERYVTIFESKW